MSSPIDERASGFTDTLYASLCEIAEGTLRRTRAPTAILPAELVHECYLKLHAASEVEVESSLRFRALAAAMIYFGFNLAQATWFQSYPEFEHIRVGVVYAAIPISGVIFLLFILEQMLFGKQGADAEEEELARAIELAEQEASS